MTTKPRDPFAKLYHFAAKINDNGDVYALCFARPRAIDLRRALWTLRTNAVTCPKCLRLLNPSKGHVPVTKANLQP